MGDSAFYDHGPAGTGEISETALQDYLGQFGVLVGFSL